MFSKTIEARNKYKTSAEEENNTLDDYANKINEIAGGMATKINETKKKQIQNADGSKTIEITGNKVTVTENGTTYTAIVDTTIDPSVGDYDENTKNVLSKVYGTEVEYKSDSDSNKDIDNKTWRIFYIDFANKYKDGAGTIYLKADWTTSNTTIGNYISYMPKDTTKLQSMNPEWWAQRGTTSWNYNERCASWLCDPTQWTKYKNDSATYAIGGPSIEMYCDSYNSVNHPAGGDVTTNYKLGTYYSSTPYPGYKYTTGGAQYNTIDYTNYDSMYCGYNKAKGDYCWWISSPSSDTDYYASGNYICHVGSGLAFLDSDGYSNTVFDLCPLASLQPNIQFTIK